MVLRNSESIRVLMICPQFHPVIGGYERAAARVSAALAEAGKHVVVITERRDRAWPAMESVDGYQVRRLFCSHHHHLHVITGLLSFTGYLLRHGRSFDVWHVHQYGHHAALAVVLGKLLRRPVMLKLTSSAAMGIASAMGTGIIGRLLSFLHRRVNICLAVSDETHAEAIRFGTAPERIFIIPNGLDSREFSPTSPEERHRARQALGLISDRLVLYVGRLSAEKNPLGLLDAWAAVDAKARKGTLLTLIGDGPQRDQVQAKVQQLNLVDSVHLAGYCDDVAAWYRAADIYVLPSLREGLSNSMIEALASGLPVISTPVSGSSILIESPAAGLLVPVGDAKQLARAIEALIRDETTRTELSKNARHKFESCFSLELVTSRLILLYSKLKTQNRALPTDFNFHSSATIR